MTMFIDVTLTLNENISPAITIDIGCNPEESQNIHKHRVTTGNQLRAVVS